MKIIDTFKINMIKKTLANLGYNTLDIDRIISVIDDNTALAYFTDRLLDKKQINECIEFLNYEDIPLKYHAINLPFENRMVIIKLFNKLRGKDVILKHSSIRLFRLIYNIACDYDERVLNHILDNILLSEINYEFLNELNEAYKNRENLYEKFMIDENIKSK